MTVVASRYVRQVNDLYETPAWVTEALLRHLPDLSGRAVWEPAAGNHRLADVLREHWVFVVTSDIETYSMPHDMTLDFFSAEAGNHKLPAHDAIITNPPYGRGNRDAVTFARLALKRCPGWVALLLTAKFDSGKTRTDLFRDNLRFAFKITLLDRIQWFNGPHGGTEDHAWFVWRPLNETPDNPALVAKPRLIYEARGIE